MHKLYFAEPEPWSATIRHFLQIQHVIDAAIYVMLYVMFSIKPGHFGTNMTALLSVAHKIVYIQAFDVLEHSNWNLFRFQF